MATGSGQSGTTGRSAVAAEVPGKRVQHKLVHSQQMRLEYPLALEWGREGEAVKQLIQSMQSPLKAMAWPKPLVVAPRLSTHIDNES